MYYNANERFEQAKAVANINDPASMKDLFNAAASKFYLERTEKTFEELEKSGWYADSRWSDWACNCTGTEWESINVCIECADIAADNAIEEEEDAE